MGFSFFLFVDLISPICRLRLQQWYHDRVAPSKSHSRQICPQIVKRLKAIMIRIPCHSYRELAPPTVWDPLTLHSYGRNKHRSVRSTPQVGNEMQVLDYQFNNSAAIVGRMWAKLPSETMEARRPDFNHHLQRLFLLFAPPKRQQRGPSNQSQTMAQLATSGVGIIH